MNKKRKSTISAKRSEPVISRRRAVGDLFSGALAMRGTAASALRGLLPGAAALGFPAVIRSEPARPSVEWGVQTGDPRPGAAVLWSRTDRPARLVAEWSTRPDMQGAIEVAGALALAGNGFTARVNLVGLPGAADLFYRVRFVSLADGSTASAPVAGHLRTAPERLAGAGQAAGGPVRFLWSGDTCGQGYGINPAWGGMRIYETMRALAPDFFIHSGDTIYADNPIPGELRLADGTIWRNLISEAKSHVAETLDDFRGNYLYNLMDAHVRRFNAEVAQIWQWDDHEVLNNWAPGKDLTGDARYREKDIQVLAARAAQAFREFAPMHIPEASGLAGGARRGAAGLYRHIPYGPLLDLFVVDLRSFRGPNTHNRQPAESGETRFLGRPQFDWLLRGLRASKARWKVVASDMPIGLLVGDGKDAAGRARFEAFANGDGPPLGRELELARLLGGLRKAGVRNTVWLTADVHYSAAHYYDPSRAQFSGFDPFWEFVSGPLHAGTFGPGELDNTFGPRVVFEKAPPKGQSNLPPSAGLQFFGEVEIDGRTAAMTVRLRDLAGAVLFTQALEPV